MIDFILTGINAALSAGDLAEDIGRHIPEGSSGRVRELAGRMRWFITGMVDAISFASRAAHDPRAGRAIAFANGQVFGYLFDENDLLPENEFGLLGLVDDAYLAHRHAAELLALFPWLAEQTGTYQVPASEQVELVRALLPAGAADALDRTSRTVVSVALALIGTAVDPHSGTASASLAPVPRVYEALSQL